MGTPLNGMGPHGGRHSNLNPYTSSIWCLYILSKSKKVYTIHTIHVQIYIYIHVFIMTTSSYAYFHQHTSTCSLPPVARWLGSLVALRLVRFVIYIYIYICQMYDAPMVYIYMYINRNQKSKMLN